MERARSLLNTAGRWPERLRPALILLSSACALGLALRIWLATHDDGIYWPDEIYQSLEPAHRLVYGQGLPTWEFVQGARSWLFPGLLAGVLKAGSVVGLTEPRAYLTLVRLLFCAVGVVTAVGCHRLARSYGASPLAAAVGGAIFALAAPAIYFAPRALSETASAPLIVFGLALALDPRGRPRRLVIGSSLLGLSVFFRLQNVIFCAGLLAILAGRREWRRVGRSATVLATCGVLFGLLDLITWGSLFHSAITYVTVNSGPEGSAQYGVSPFTYYLNYSLSALGPLALAMAVLSLVAWLRAPGLVLLVGAYVLLHSIVGHKELRFLIPALPLGCALTAIGLDTMAASMSRARWKAALSVTIGSALLSGLTFRQLTFGDLGAYVDSRPAVSAYDDSGPVNRLLLVARERRDLCGLKVESVRMLWAGGYTYLHRSVPLYPPESATDNSQLYNYVITIGDRLADGRTTVAREGGQVLARLANEHCRPDPRRPDLGGYR